MSGGLITIWISFMIVGLSMPFIPYMTRKTENFGVTIPEQMYERDDFKQMRKQYTASLLILFALLIILSGILSSIFSEKINAFILSSALVIDVIASFLLYLPFHSTMKNMKAQEGWHEKSSQTIVIDTTFRKEKLIHSNYWFLLPSILVIATVGITFYLYDQIPNQLPMHTDFGGNVTYDEKSVRNLLFLPGTQVFMVGLFILINLVIKHAKQQVDSENPERSKQQNIQFRRRWSEYTIVTCILTVLLFGYIQFSFIYPTLEAYTDMVLIIFIALILCGTILLSIKTGQGGSRIKVDAAEPANGKTSRDDDRYWKLGQFYVNKNDPSLFVEKRFGIGWTNNWAHPLSWIFILGVILVPLMITWILI